MMNEPIPVVAKCRINGILLEVCHGEISDIFRLLWFGPVTEFELPDTKRSDEEFRVWLEFYRPSSSSLGKTLLEITQCS